MTTAMMTTCKYTTKMVDVNVNVTDDNHANITIINAMSTTTVNATTTTTTTRRCKYDYIFFDWKGTLACKGRRTSEARAEDKIKKLHGGFSEHSFLFPSVDVTSLDQFRKVYQDVHAKLTTERGVGCYNWTEFLENLWVALGVTNFTNEQNMIIPEITTDFFDDNIELYREAIRILNLLRDHNIPIGLIRNSKLPASEMRKKLAKVKVDSFFEVVVMAGDVGIQKPNKEVFELAVKEANIEQLHKDRPERILFVGNETDKDVVGANRVGWTSVLVCHTEDGSKGLANFDIANLGELEKIIFE